MVVFLFIFYHLCYIKNIEFRVTILLAFACNEANIEFPIKIVLKSISKNNDPLIKNEVDNLFRKRFYEKILQRSKVLFIASMILYPAWAINDYIFARDLFYLFLGLRLLALVVMLVCFILMVKRKLHPYWATQIIFLLVVTEIAYMCAIVPEDSLITYYIGFSTAFAAYYSVVIIPYSLSLLCYLYGAASFWFFIKIVGIHDELMYLKNGGLFFVFFDCIIFYHDPGNIQLPFCLE